MVIGLIFTLCTVMAGGVDECDKSYVLDVYNGPEAITECMAAMDANLQTLDDRYLSCGKVNPRGLVKRGADAGMTVAQQIERINAENPYHGE